MAQENFSMYRFLINILFPVRDVRELKLLWLLNIRNMIVTLPFQTLESIGTRQNQRLSV